jgi:hypothetical protein
LNSIVANFKEKTSSRKSTNIEFEKIVDMDLRLFDSYLNDDLEGKEKNKILKHLSNSQVEYSLVQDCLS